ncbi:MAG: hypothetical protein PHU80_00695, partial [Kiritimatiellae bacterium]|nr:hypothetical protein [Kiritimatiellia bacterium]
VVPLKLVIRDPSGDESEWSGYYGAKDGTLDIQLAMARNDTPGMWQIKARELASGRQGVKYFRLNSLGDNN